MLAPAAVLLLASYVGPVASPPRHAGAPPPVHVERGVDRGDAKHAHSHTQSKAQHSNTGTSKAHKSQHGHGHARH